MGTARPSSSSLLYVPELLSDELLYCWLARLSALNGWGTGRSAVRRLFGGWTTSPGIVLPTHLSSVVSACEHWLPCRTITDLIEVSTLLPYFRPFLQPARCSHLVEDMHSASVSVLNARLGLAANRFGTGATLRFCPKCAAEDVSVHGCFFWHRQHHLPGVESCVHHAVRLQRYLPTNRCSSTAGFVYPGMPSEVDSPCAATPLQLRFAEISAAVLNASLPAIDPEVQAKTYRRAMLAKGYLKRQGRPSYAELAIAVRQHFDDFDGFEHKPRLLATSANPLCWIQDLVEHPNRSKHPICHIVLIEFLFGSIAALSDALATERGRQEVLYPEEQAFPSIKVKPVNPLLEVSAEEMLRDTSQSCCEVAKKIGTSVNTIVQYRREHGIHVNERRKSINGAKRQSIVADLNNNFAFSEIAKRNCVSVRTVYRESAYSGVKRSNQLNAPTVFQLNERRSRWLGALKQLGGRGVSAARATARSDYFWLYRNDREWLLSINLLFEKNFSIKSTTDWQTRDQELYNRAQSVALTLSKISPPTRISVSRIRSALGNPSLRHPEKLPKFTEFLANISESIESFKMRRIDYAIKALHHSGVGLNPWRVKRAAGFRLWPPELIEYMLKKISQLPH